MNFKRVCKSALCLLVACFLVFNIVSIPARATGLGAIATIEAIGTALGPVGTVAAASVIALGLYAGANPDDFDAIVDGVSSAMSDIGTNMKDGFVQMLQVTDSQGYKQLYVAADWLENVRSWLFDSGTLSVAESYVFPNSTSEAISELYASVMSYPYHYVAYNTNNLSWYFICSEGPILFTPKDGGGYWIHTEEKTWYGYKLSGASYQKFANAKGNKTGTFDRISETGLVEDFATSFELSLGVVSNSAIINDVSVYSPTWNANQIRVATANPDGSDPEYKVYFPLSLPSTYEDLHSVTQSDILSGSVLGTPDLEEDEEYKIEELPLIDGYQGVMVSPSGTQSGTQSGTNTGTVTLPGWLSEGISNLLQGLKDILSGILALPAAIAKAIWDALPAWIQEGILNMIAGLSNILDAIVALPAAIAEALAAVFIPSADYITAKVDALRGEFGFIDSVIATGEFIRDSVSGASGPPAIYVNLGNAPSGNYGSQRVLLTDFSWYAPYKSQVDTVLSAALWAFFGWKVFLNLPSIIGGESGYISDIAFYESGGYYGGRAREIRSGRGSRSKGKGGK